jgi:hypothetical protein
MPKTTQPENFRLWIHDLRTTIAPQAQRQLRNGDGFCCLGRACEVFRTTTGKGEWTATGDFVLKDKRGAYLPPEVSDWLGVIGNDPIAISMYNDRGSSFHVIAGILEEHYL